MIKKSGLELSTSYEEHDANKLLVTKIDEVSDLPKGCLCGLVILGKKDAKNCQHFLNRCTPVTAIGR